MKQKIILLTGLVALLFSCRPVTDQIQVESFQPVIPVLALKAHNPVLRLKLIRTEAVDYTLEQVVISLEGTTDLNEVEAVGLYLAGADGEFSTDTLLAEPQKGAKRVRLSVRYPVDQDTLTCWVSVTLKDAVGMKNQIQAACSEIRTSLGRVNTAALEAPVPMRVGVALRQHMQDGVHTSRIPGLTTSTRGTLLAIYDARRESGRDLQGDMDIGMNRSTDGGKTWSPMQVVLDMGTWGGLPERYNGVSDACILSDDNTGTLYVIGLWMHGILDPANGRWVEGLTDTSTVWNHQWRSHGSQPGYDVKRSAQFLITKSTDDGLTWSKPENITRQVKKEEWWLLAPAPGAGITLSDGTLVFPTEGRDKTGLQFSTITWSKDGGKTWTTGTPAYTNTNECMAVELSDGAIMLNMRERSNRGRMEGNGRAIAVTRDLGETWTEHPTSRRALIEPACQASIHRHFYTEGGVEKSVLVFLNPNSKTTRNNITLKVSFDDGNTWPESHWMLLDQWQGAGYSCITSIDQQTLGVLYEGSGADMVFQQIPVEALIHPQKP